MNIGIVGTNTTNKGAELMQVAIQEHLREVSPDIQLAVTERFGSYDERSQYGLRSLPLLRSGRAGLRLRLAMRVLPTQLRRSLGVVTEDEMDAILDASGFAFGDQWLPKHVLQRVTEFERWQKQGKPVILLPQALGPFEQPSIRSAFERILKASTLVYARDQISLEYARGVLPQATNLRLAPDFTNLVIPLALEEVGSINRALIVPNKQMIEKVNKEEQKEAYVSLLVNVIRAVKSYDVDPVLLAHSSKDALIVDSVQKDLGEGIDTIEESDPVRIKAEIGKSRLLVGSRFHALVSALTQGVPAVATSWSHKYEMLFADYECADLVLPVSASTGQVESAIEITLGEERSTLISQLHRKSDAFKNQTRAMWEEVGEILGIS